VNLAPEPAAGDGTLPAAAGEAASGSSGSLSQEGMDSLRRLAAGSLLSTAGLVASAALGFAVVLTVTRGLGSVGAGVFFQSVALFSILAAVADLGASTGLVRTIPRFRTIGRAADVRRAIRVALWPVGSVAVVMAVALVVSAPWVASIMGLDPLQGSSFLRTLAPFLPVAAVSTVLLAVSRGFGRMGPYTTLEHVMKPGLRPVLILAAVAAGLGTSAALLAWAVPTALILPPAAIVAARLLRKERPRLEESPAISTRTLTSQFWRFAAPRGLAAVFHIGIVWLDVVLVGSLRSTAEAGIYAAVGRLIQLGVVAIEGVRLALAPHISAALARGDRREAQLLYRVGTGWLVAASWPLYLAMAVFAPLVLRIFGLAFAEGSAALLIVSLAMLVGVGTGNVSVVLLMGGKSVWNLANTGAALVVNVALNLILIPRLGMAGAAIAWTASLLVNNVVPLAQVWRSMRVHPFGPGFLIAAGLSTLCYGVIGILVRSVMGTTAEGFALYAVAATALYVPLLIRFRGPLNLDRLKDALLAGRDRVLASRRRTVRGP
jgi:O-antigen/teichoic acid export membrane protein